MARRRAGIMEAPSNVANITPVDSGVADTSFVWRQAAEGARRAVARVQPALNQQAEAAARRDFEGGQVALRNVWFAEDEVYNNAMLQSWAARSTIDVSSRAMELEAEHGLDVEGFDRAWEQVRTGFIGEAPEDMAPHMALLLDREHAEVRQRIGQRRRNAAIERVGEDAAALLSHMESQLSGYTDLASPEYQDRVREYREQGEAFSANPLTGLSPEEWRFRYENTLARHQARAFQETGLALYEEGGGNAASAQSAIERTRALIYDPGLSLTEAQREAAFGDVRQAVSGAERARVSAEREARAEMRAYRAEARDMARGTIAEIQERMRAFAPIDDVTLNELAQTAQASGSPAIARQANEVFIQERTRRRLRGLSLAEIEVVADELQQQAAAGGESAYDIAIALNATRAYATHLRRGDPLDVGQVHFGQQPPPVTGQGADIGARIRYAEAVAADIGAAQPSYFQRGEREVLAGIAREGGEQALALAMGIVSAAYEEEGGDAARRAQQMMGEIGGRDAPALLASGNVLLMGGQASENTARLVMDAQRLRNQPGYTRPDFPGVQDPTERTRLMENVLGDLRTSMTPTALQELRVAADLIYEGRVANNPDYNTAGNYRSAYESSIRMALGGVTRDVNGQRHSFGGVARGRGEERVLVPNWLRTDQFDSVRSGLRVEDYANGSWQVPGLAPALPISTLRQARWVSAGRPGAYYLMNDDDTAIAIAPGVPYILDLNLIRDSLRERRRDAVAP